jgi:acyl-CoA hydrolase
MQFAPQSLPGTIRLCSPQEAAALVRSGDKIAISANANTPRVWLEALFARAEQLEDVEIMHMRLVGARQRAEQLDEALVEGRVALCASSEALEAARNEARGELRPVLRHEAVQALTSVREAAVALLTAQAAL